MPRAQIKDEKTYQAMRREGESKEKAARVANSRAGGGSPGHKGGKSGTYEDRSKQDLYEQARRVGIEGRSRMTKSQLIDALRHH
ncbi:Rho termination factor N-terminal domain-containing protein [Streptomyces sp. CHA1]|uniref:DUF7218 family protein n=1 Tax=Streptomyces TaxID=1883 RepID=UPI00053DE9BD|nr:MULTISPECIES: Rho termination factor N-terminal domain-containing protein [unclassified Streptomyces]WSB20135.1 Rho termination factor N-terminal domain-containing protein [Streptomyces albidoflavus]MBP3080011.1 Rho termination factor [Streptomyces sp. 604F]MBT3157624.1 Rho termination factor N-terminal domain-containing protein [Streptomyces sp. G11C]MCO6703001.1 Rho termination factor N-terminal domain-containing protein [Streptomyces sp. CHB9.2]MCO6709438.1 Rho termination factor N-termi